MSLRLVLVGVPCVAMVVAATILLLGGGPAPAAPGAPVQPPRGAHVGCDRQSIAGVPGTSGFPRAYVNSRNLVVGPLALIGAGTVVDAATAREHGGSKFPLLVRAGRRVTVSVPASHRAIAGLDYGFQPVPQHTIAFVACSARRARSRAGGPVTFWAGSVTTSVPACVPLDVWVDDGPRRRVAVALGRSCAGGGGAAPLPPLRDCATRAEAGRPENGRLRRDDVVLGPVRFVGLGRLATRRAFAFDRAGHAYRPRRGGRTFHVHRVKAGIFLPAGASVTLSIGAGARGWAALGSTRTAAGVPAVRFTACAADERAFSYDGIVGPVTGFAGGFVLARPGCVPLVVTVPGQPPVRARVPFGVGHCR